MVILTILILKMQGHFHLCLAVFRTVTSYADLSQGCFFFFFDAMVDGIVSLISLSDISLLLYKMQQTSIFLYPVAEPNSLMYARLSGVSVHMDITRWSTAKSDWLYSLQPKMEKLYTVNKSKTRSLLWFRS